MPFGDATVHLTHTRSYQSTVSKLEPTVATNLQPPHPGGDEGRREGGGGQLAKSPHFLCTRVTLGHSTWESGFVLAPRGRAAGTLENKSQQNPARAWQPIWLSGSYLKS